MLAHTSVVYHMSYITKFLVTQQLNNSSTSLGDSVRVRERERESRNTGPLWHVWKLGSHHLGMWITHTRSENKEKISCCWLIYCFCRGKMLGKFEVTQHFALKLMVVWPTWRTKSIRINQIIIWQWDVEKQTFAFWLFHNCV